MFLALLWRHRAARRVILWRPAGTSAPLIKPLMNIIHPVCVRMCVCVCVRMICPSSLPVSQSASQVFQHAFCLREMYSRCLAHILHIAAIARKNGWQGDGVWLDVLPSLVLLLNGALFIFFDFFFAHLRCDPIKETVSHRIGTR